FGEIVRIALNNNIFGITNGAAGLPKAGVLMPDPAGLPWLRNNAYFSIPGVGPNGFNFTFTPNVYWYYIIVLLCLFTIFVVTRLDNSRLGRSWTAMREDEVAASSMGVNITGAKLWAFSLGATWGGIAGITFANFQGFVSPESFTFMESVFVVSIIVLGGMGSIPGAIVGALIIQGVPEFIRGLSSSGFIPMSAEMQSAVSNYRYLVFGALMVIMMAWRPQGIIPSKRRARELHPDDERMLDIENETLFDAQHGSSMPGEDTRF
ncbi:MAG: ABC transporter ATP-binding protein, partial [Actinobacteria bacterium]